MTKTIDKPIVADRFCVAKDFVRASGHQSWGVFDDIEKKFVEGGFFKKLAAQSWAAKLNREAKGGR